MMKIIFIISFIFLLGYCIFLFVFIIADLFISKKTVNNTNKTISPSVSIICCARNEEKNLIPLLNSLQKQEYPKENFEIILVNDNSFDNTNQILEEYAKHSKIKLLLIKKEDKIPSKKKAIELGIKKSKGEIILFTDADCIINKNWIKTYIDIFQNNKILFITGKVLLSTEKNNFLTAFQNTEWSALMKITAVSIKIKFPLMANGANMAIRKEIFLTLNPYQNNYNIASGDDMFLLQSVIKNHSRKSVAYNNDSTITTIAAKTWNDFFSQRIRWAKKNYYGSIKTFFAPFFIFMVNLSTILLFIIAEIKPHLLLFVCLLLGIKFIEELFLMLLQKQRKTSLIYYPLNFILYPFYVVFIAIISLFVSVKWKGNKTKA